MKNMKNGVGMSNWLLSATILARWRRPVVSNIALDLLHWAMCAVSYRHTATAIKMASKYGAFFVVVFFIETMAAAGAKRSE
jgi:hypothetical protein